MFQRIGVFLHLPLTLRLRNYVNWHKKKEMKNKIEKDKMADRKQYQKQYQKNYAASGKKSEVAKRYYQKHKYEICEKLKNKRKLQSLLDNSSEITSILGHKFNKK